MAGNVLAELVVLITGNASSAVAAFGQVEKAMGSLATIGAAMTAVGTLMTIGLTVPIMALGAVAVESFLKIQEGYKIIEGQTGTTGAELEKLKGAFDTVFAEVPQSAKEVATVISIIHDKLEELNYDIPVTSKRFLDLARITGEAPAKVAEGLASMLLSWKVPMDQSDAALDLIYTAFTKTHVPITTLTEDVDKQGQVMRQAYGFTLPETIALFASLNEVGISTQDIIRGLDYGWAKLTQAMDGSTKVSKQMQPVVDGVNAEITKLGLSSTSSGDRMYAFFKGIQDGSIKSGDAIAVFGPRFSAQITTAIQEGRLDFQGFLDLLKEAPADLDKFGVSTLNFSQKLELLKHQLMEAFAPIGEAITDALLGFMPVIQAIAGAIEGLAKSFNNLPAPIKNFVLLLLAIVAAVGPVLMIIGVLISSIASIVGVVGPAIMGLIGFLLGIPAAIGGIIGAVGFLVDVFGTFGLSLGAVSTALLGLGVPAGAVAAIVTALGSPIILLVGAFAALAAIIVGAVIGAFITLMVTSQTWRNLVGGLITGVMAEFGNLAKVVGDVFNDLKTGNIKAALDEVMSYVSGLANRIANIDWGNVWNQMVTSLRESISTIGTVIGGLRDQIAAWADQQDWTEIGRQIGQFIGEGIVLLVQSIPNILQIIWDAISGQNTYATAAGTAAGEQYGNGISSYFKSGQLKIDLTNAITIGQEAFAGIAQRLQMELGRIHIDWAILGADIGAVFQYLGTMAGLAFSAAIVSAIEGAWNESFGRIFGKVDLSPLKNAITDQMKDLKPPEIQFNGAFKFDPSLESQLAGINQAIAQDEFMLKMDIDPETRAKVESDLKTLTEKRQALIDVGVSQGSIEGLKGAVITAVQGQDYKAVVTLANGDQIKLAVAGAAAGPHMANVYVVNPNGTIAAPIAMSANGPFPANAFVVNPDGTIRVPISSSAAGPHNANIVPTGLEALHLGIGAEAIGPHDANIQVGSSNVAENTQSAAAGPWAAAVSGIFGWGVGPPASIVIDIIGNLVNKILGEGGIVTKAGEGGVAQAQYGLITRGPQLVIAGEAGDEAFVPLKAGKIPVQLNTNKAMGATVNNKQKTYNINVSGIKIEEVASEIMRRLRINELMYG